MTDRSLRLDRDGHPHIAYGADGMYYAYHDGSVWHYATVDWESAVGEGASLALDSRDWPHISYYDAGTQDLKYAWYDGTVWQTETVDSEGSVGTYSSLALDELGRPRISYYDADRWDLKYARKDGPIWKTNFPLVLHGN